MLILGLAMIACHINIRSRMTGADVGLMLAILRSAGRTIGIAAAAVVGVALLILGLAMSARYICPRSW